MDSFEYKNVTPKSKMIEILMFTFSTLQCGEISICDLAKCITQSESDYNLMEKMSVEEILTILRKVGDTSATAAHFNGRRKKNSVKQANKKVTKFVSENCDCIMFNVIMRS